jgi:hypothetical protein
MMNTHTLLVISLFLMMFGLTVFWFAGGWLFRDWMYHHHAPEKTATIVEQIRQRNEQRKRQLMKGVDDLTEEAIRKMVNAAEEQKRKSRTNHKEAMKNNADL